MASSTLHVLPDAANNSATTSPADANEIIVSDYAGKILRVEVTQAPLRSTRQCRK